MYKLPFAVIVNYLSVNNYLHESLLKFHNFFLFFFLQKNVWELNQIRNSKTDTGKVSLFHEWTLKIMRKIWKAQQNMKAAGKPLSLAIEGLVL